MNLKVVLKTTGKIILLESALLILPLFISIYYNENTQIYFIKSILISLGVGLFLSFIPGKGNKIYAKEGFLIVSLSWVIISVLGALPFYLSGEIPKFIDALLKPCLDLLLRV